MQITKERKKELTNMYLDLHRQLNDCVDNHDSAYKVQFYLSDLLHKLAYRVEFADYDCEKNKKTLVFESYNPPADLEIYYAKSDIYSETESVGVYIFLNENAFRKAKSDLDEDSFWWYQKEK